MEKLKLLVVDDATFIRDLVKKSIRQKYPNISVAEAVDGRKAQVLMGKSQFDMILCDWEMPEMDGEQLLQWVRAQPQHEKTPFIMVTSRGEKDHVLQALQSGVSEYLTKPFTNEQLYGKVNKLLKRHGKLEQALMSSRNPLAGSSAGSASVLTQGSSNPAPASSSTPKAMPKATTQLRFSGQQHQCLLKRLDHTQLHGVIKRDTKLPNILEQAVIDLVFDAGEGEDIARINGFVSHLQATEDSMNSRFVNICIRIVDQDSTKLDAISHFLKGIGQA